MIYTKDPVMLKHKFYKIVQTSKHREDNIPWRAKLYTDGTYNMYCYMKGYVVVESKVACYVSPPIVFTVDGKLSDLILSLEYIGKNVMRDGREAGMICRPWIEPEK